MRLESKLEASRDVDEQLQIERLRYQELESELEALRGHRVEHELLAIDGAEIRALQEQVQRAEFARDAAVLRGEEARTWAQEAHEKEQFVWRETAEKLTAQCNDLRASLVDEVDARKLAESEGKRMQLAADAQDLRFALLQSGRCDVDVQTIQEPIASSSLLVAKLLPRQKSRRFTRSWPLCVPSWQLPRGARKIRCLKHGVGVRRP